MPQSSKKTPNIVFTKPAHQALALQSLIDSESQNVPLFDIEFLGDQHFARETLLDLAEFTHIVVTSPNAAAALLELMDQYWPMLPEDPKWFCPGAGTAKVLASDYQYPIQAMYPHTGSSSEHVLALEACELDHLSKVLIVKGEGGRGLIQQTVLANGGKVSELNLYRRNALELDYYQKETICSADLLVVSSLDVLLALTSQLGTQRAKLAHTTLLVTSERLLDRTRELMAELEQEFERELMRESKPSSIIQSTRCPIIHIQKADNESIAQAVNQWFKDLEL
jgi:uroporphyrinogen-III synthase